MKPSDFSADAPGRLVPTIDGQLAFVPHPPLAEIVFDASTTLLYGDAERALGELKGTTQRLVNPYLIGRPLLRREALLSSKIEGTITTPEQLVLVEATEGTAEQSESDRDTQEVFNYMKAMYHGLSRLTDLPVSLRLIREVHEVLLSGVRGEGERPGEFRSTQNWIGRYKTEPITEARYVPPPVPEMHEALGQLEEYLHAEVGIPLLVKLAVVHYQFEAIHPFRDGNGRIGRLLIPLLLCSHRYVPDPLLYLSPFFERNYDAYVHLMLRVSQGGEWSQWIRFFLQGIAECSRESVVQAEALLALRDEWRTRFQAARSSALILKLIDELFQSPAMGIPRMSDLLGVTYNAAWSIANKLLDAGILVTTGDRRRNRIFYAPAIMAFMHSPPLRTPQGE